jgi:hypothetical protein
MGNYKAQVTTTFKKTERFVAIYPDAPLDLIKMLVEVDFQDASDLKFRRLPMRTKLPS